MLGGFLLLTRFFFEGDSLSNILIGAVLAVLLTIVAFRFLLFLLPTDHGRAYAVEGSASKGKPTGAGFLFITVFCVVSYLFLTPSLPYAIYIFLIEAAMIFGFLDDAASKPWNEYLKGAIDLAISFSAALTFALFFDRTIYFPILHLAVLIPFPLYILLGTLLVWVAINVTNCTDGVDGLSSSMTIVSIGALAILSYITNRGDSWSGTYLLLFSVLCVYLWKNTNPSSLLMGDAGSRALGVFLAISFMQSRMPVSYLFLCLLFILNGGAGIVKISLKRFLKISILKNTLTPFHDHLRKRLHWSNPQVTYRMTLIHAGICFLYLAVTVIRLRY